MLPFLKLFAKEEMFKNLTDNQLIAQYKQGNIKVFEEIVKRYSGLVRSICRSYFLLDGEWDDLYQEGFLGLLKAVNTFSEDKVATFKTFAYTCISSSVKTAVRRSLNKSNMILNTAISLQDAYFLETENLEDAFISDESSIELVQKIKGVLSSFENKVLYFWLGGLSYEETALRLAKPVKSIDNAIQRIKKKVAQLVSAD